MEEEENNEEEVEETEDDYYYPDLIDNKMLPSREDFLDAIGF